MPRAPTTARIATVRAELRDDTAFVATPTPRLSWTVETDEPGWRAGLRRAARRRRVRDARRPTSPCSSRGRSRRSRAGETRDRCGCARPRHPAPTPSGASRSRSPPASSARASGSREPIGLADPDRAAQPALVRTRFTVDATGRAARSCSGRPSASPSPSSTAPRSTTTCSRPAGRATATASCTRPSTSPRSCARARTCSARPSRAPGTPRSTASSVRRPRLRRPAERSSRSSASSTPTAACAGRRHRRRLAGVRRRARSSTAASTRASTPTCAVADVAAGRASGVRRVGVAPRPAAGHPLARATSTCRCPRRASRRPCAASTTLPVADVITSPSGATILDFGQNLVGRLRITVRRPGRHAPHAPPRRGARRGRARAPPAAQRRRPPTCFDLAGDGPVTWEPRFTFHGFRYAAIDGLAGRVRPRRRRGRGARTAT